MHVKNSIFLVLLAGLAGCANLPTSGPTKKQIEASLRAPDTDASIQLVQVQTAADVPGPPPGAPATLLPELAPPSTDMIGSGDVLDVNIYEAGVTLFSGGGGAGEGAMNQLAVNPGVQVQKMPPSRVDDNGNITIPYIGKLRVAGHTISEAEAMVRSSLRQMSQNPQVLITFTQTITNSIIVGGEVVNPGRLVLQTNRETLSDVIALAGGYRGNARDLVLRITRGSAIADVRVDDLVNNPRLDVRAYPGDRVTLINDPLSFSVLGASGRVEQIPFAHSTLSLAEAIANAGGSHPNQGDPRAIFLFRYVKDKQGNDVPKVFHINMMQASSFFLAQRFAMQDRDVLYFGNAAANQPSKMAQLVSQFFTPLLTVTSAVRLLQEGN